MGFTYQELKRIKENCFVWEKEENTEIEQNSLGLYKKKHSLIKQRFYSKPPKKCLTKNYPKEQLKKESLKDSSIPIKVLLHTLVWEQEEQQEFVDKVENTKQQLASLEETINHEIKTLQQPSHVKVKKNIPRMEREKYERKKKLEDNEETTWADFFAAGKGKKLEPEDIAKERYSLQHQCVCTSPRYYSDKNLSLRPRMRSVASQVGAGEEFADQGAVGDHNNLKNLKSLGNLKAINVCSGFPNHAVVNCCYGLTNQPAGFQHSVKTAATNGVQCQHYNYQQRGLENNREYNYCHEENYYNFANCNCPKPYSTCCQNPTKTTAHYRRQSTDLNTQHFYSRPVDETCSPERRSNSKSKKKKDSKTVKCKSKESSEEYNERKKKECEERLDKLKEKTSKRQRSNSAEGNEKYSTKSQKLKKLSKEENASKLIKYMDQYVEEHLKELREDFKKLQSKQDSCSSEPSTTLKIKSEEKYCHVNIRKNQKVSSKLQQEFEVDSSLETQYSLATLKMLKKMTIREYKPLKNMEKQKDKSHSLANNDLNKQRLEKFKKYQEYMEKYEKEKEINKSLQVLKSPPPNCSLQQESEENEIFQKYSKIDSFIDTLRDPRQVTREQTIRVSPRYNREQALTSREQLVKEREQLRLEEAKVYKEPQQTLKAKTNERNKSESFTESESYQEFRYEYGDNVKDTKNWDDYGKYKEQNKLIHRNNNQDKTQKLYREKDTISQDKKYFLEAETNEQDSAKFLTENAYYKDFPNDYKPKGRAQENWDIYGNKEKAGHKKYNTDFEETRKGKYFKVKTGDTQENQGRLALLQNDVDSYRKFEDQDHKAKDLTTKYYEDKRREVLETKQYSGGNLRDLEYKEMKIEQKYIKESFKDLKNKDLREDRETLRKFIEKDPRTYDHISSIIKDKRDSREERNDFLEQEYFASKDQRSKYYEDKRRDFREERQQETKQPKSKYYANKKREYRDGRQPAIEEQSSNYYENKWRGFKEEIKTPRSKYFEDKREDSRDGRQPQNEEQRSSYYEHQREDQSSKYCDEKRRDSLEEKYPATDEQSSEYYEDKRKDSLGKRQTLTEQQSLKYYEDKKKDFKEEIQHETKEARSKYYADKSRDSRDEKHPTTEEQRCKYYERKREDQSSNYYADERKDSLKEKHAANGRPILKYYEDKRRDFREDEQSSAEQQSSKYYGDKNVNSREETSSEIEEQRCKYFRDKIRDSLDVGQAATNKQRQLQSKQEVDRFYEFPICPKTKKSADYEHEPSQVPLESEVSFPSEIETQNYRQKRAIDDHDKHEREEEGASVRTSFEKEILAQAQDSKREFKISHSKEQKEYPIKELPKTKYQKETQEYPLKQEDLKPQRLSTQTESFYNEDPQSFYYENVPEMDKKSQTSSYKDFKQVMDQNLGFYTNTHSQTDYNLEYEINKQFSTQTFNKETQPASSSSIPKTTEEVLNFLKNLIESSPKLNLESECLNSVTLAAKDLITKLSSCQNSLKTETMTNTEKRKSSEDIENYNLEEKSTPDTQYKDLETTTDSSENQLRKPANREERNDFITPNEVENPEVFHNYEIREVAKEPEDLNFLQESCDYQSQMQPQLWQSTETYQSCLKYKENFNSLKPPQEFMDEQESLYPNLSQNTPLHTEYTQKDPLNVEVPLIYQIAGCEPYLENNNSYRPLPSPRRQAAFDPDLVPLKGILKPCRIMENSETLSCDMLAQKTTSVVNFDHKDEINIQMDTSMICQRGPEEIAQQFNETQEIIITKDETLQPIKKHTKHMLTAQTSIAQPICQVYQQESQGKLSMLKENHHYIPGIPAFKQCPCMLKTYKKMLTNYYKGKINKDY